MLLRLELFFFIAAITILSIATFQRNIIWATEIGIWQDAVKKSPFKARPHTNMGILYDLNGNIDKAAEEYKKAVQLEPNYLGPYAPLAVIYGKQGDIDKAIEIFLWLIPRLPNKDYKTHTGLGVAYKVKGLFKEAEIEFQKALLINPNYGTAHYNLAEIYEQMGLRDEALKHYQLFIENAPPGKKEMAEKIRDRLK